MPSYSISKGWKFYSNESNVDGSPMVAILAPNVSWGICDRKYM